MGFPYQYGNYGDYYQGDYYQGDIFGSIFKGITGAVGGLISGGPIAAIKGGVSGLIGQTKQQIPKPPTPQGVPSTYPGAVPTPGIVGTAQRILPGGASGYQSPACASPGYHRNKALARYERAVAQGRQVKPPHVVNTCVRNRSMNPLNPKALRRSIRRQQQMKSLMTRVLKGTGYKISRTGMGTRKRKR